MEKPFYESKSHIDPNTIILDDFNALLSPIDRSSKHKIKKEICELNNTINQMDLMYIYRIFQ